MEVEAEAEVEEEWVNLYLETRVAKNGAVCVLFCGIGIGGGGTHLLFCSCLLCAV